MTETSTSPSGWNRELLFVLGATFLAYANNSVFFQFYEYLQSLPIEARWFGLLISVFSAVSLLVRPIASSLLHGGNAYRCLLAGTVLVIATLASSAWAATFGKVVTIGGRRSGLAVVRGFSQISRLPFWSPA
jgi:hypothetical protein